MDANYCPSCGRALANGESLARIAGRNLCAVCAGRAQATNAPAFVFQQPPITAPQPPAQPVDEDAEWAAIHAATQRRSRTSPKPVKKRPASKSAIYVVTHLVLAAVVAGLWYGGVFRGRAESKSEVVAVNDAEEYVVHRQLNALVQEANLAIQSRQYDAAKQKLNTAKEIAQRSKSASVQARVPQIQVALDALNRGTAPAEIHVKDYAIARAKADSLPALQASQTQSPIQPPPQRLPRQQEPVPAPPPSQTVPVAAVTRAPLSPTKWLNATDPTQLSRAGWLALRQHDASTALQLFDRAVSLNRNDLDATLGLAIAKFLSGQHTAQVDALRLFDQLLMRGKKERTIVINAAAAYADSIPMRSAKILADYLESQSTPDELALNYMGTALSRASNESRKTTAVSSLQEKYLAFEKRLERTTGKKRWGATTPPDAEERLSAYQSAGAAVDQARSELEQARTKLDTLKQQFQDAIHSHRTRDEEGFQIAITAQQREIQNAALRLDRAQASFATVESPPWPGTIDWLIPDSPLPE